MPSLRQEIRIKRRQLDSRQRYRDGKRLCYQVCKFARLRSQHHIAVYLNFDGELSTRFLINKLKQLGHRVYLPILFKGKLKFARDNKRRYRNCFGIEEPRGQLLNAKQLTFVFMPLVAFDPQCNRLGMGGGFYDKSFAFRKQKKSPKLYGLAFDCQCVDQLATNPWDVPLDGILTPTRFYQR